MGTGVVVLEDMIRVVEAIMGSQYLVNVPNNHRHITSVLVDDVEDHMSNWSRHITCCSILLTDGNIVNKGYFAPINPNVQNQYTKI